MIERMKKFSDYIEKSVGTNPEEPEGVLKGRFKVMKSDDACLWMGECFYACRWGSDRGLAKGYC